MQISSICVCGAGTMGSGIAQVVAQSGFTTIQYDTNLAMLQKSKEAITKNLSTLVAKGKLTTTSEAAILNRIVFTNNLDACFANVYIEAIIENKEVKQQLFTQLHGINSAAIFATNTSSISIETIAANFSAPERVIGMHFFNPAPIMKLVEVIKTNHTSAKVVQAIMQLTQTLGKTPVLCSDAPGFIVNRVARHFYLEAMQQVQNGQITIEQADAILEATGFKMGPFKLMDLIGMDINYGVSNIVWEALNKPARLQPSTLQKQKVEAGELGRKTGKGFYNYT
jgi:3-hydroxybutyryl-CoA dehydrogenase